MAASVHRAGSRGAAVWATDVHAGLAHAGEVGPSDLTPTAAGPQAPSASYCRGSRLDDRPPPPGNGPMVTITPTAPAARPAAVTMVAAVLGITSARSLRFVRAIPRASA